MRGQAMKKVLVLDDDPEIVNHLIKSLSKEGYRAIPCYQSFDAVSLSHKELPDLIITDYNLKYGSGITFLKGIKSSPKTCGIPVVFITAYPFDKVKKEALSLGAVKFIMKPFDTESLMKEIREILDKNEDSDKK
jgi:DNA-binding response OmpR family regulator